MNITLIGEQIAKFRKAAGLTQEGLGKAVGVSTQAVSRWECGGAPDVALLPAIADELRVSIDALFGREGGVKEDITGEVQRWLLSIPDGKRMERLGQLMWQSVKVIGCQWLEQPELRYVEHCTLRLPGEEGDGVLLRTVLDLENEGLIFGVGAEEMSFFSVWPRPEAGYAAYFPPYDACRRLFQVLSRPGCLELLEYLHDQACPRYYSAEALAKRVELPAADAVRLLEEMKQVFLVKTMELELAGGPGTVYGVHENWAFVPFLSFTRCLMEEHDAFYLVWDDQDMPNKARRTGTRSRLQPRRMTHEPE